MKKIVFIIAFASFLTACASSGGSGTTTSRYFVPKVTSATEATTTTETTTTAKKDPYVEGYYDINYTTKKIHRSGCDHLVTDKGQKFDIMVKNISRDLIDKKRFSSCMYCKPELPDKKEKSYEMSELYLAFFSEYALNVGDVAPAAVGEKLHDHPELKAEYEKGGKNALQSYKITDESGDYVYMTFYPRFKGDVVEGLESLTYHHGDKEITISDNTHISELHYSTFDENRKPKRENVQCLGDLEDFMFA